MSNPKRNKAAGASPIVVRRRVGLQMTYQLAWSSALDHGNRHARRNGRKVWTSDDFNAASVKLDELVTKHELHA